MKIIILLSSSLGHAPFVAVPAVVDESAREVDGLNMVLGRSHKLIKLVNYVLTKMIHFGREFSSVGSGSTQHGSGVSNIFTYSCFSLNCTFR